MEDGQADAGRDGRTRLARPNSQARTGTGKYIFSRSADHEQDCQPHPVDPHSAVSDDHAYINTVLDLVEHSQSQDLTPTHPMKRVILRLHYI